MLGEMEVCVPVFEGCVMNQQSNDDLTIGNDEFDCEGGFDESGIELQTYEKEDSSNLPKLKTYVDLTLVDLNDEEMAEKAVKYLIGMDSLSIETKTQKYLNFASKINFSNVIFNLFVCLIEVV